MLKPILFRALLALPLAAVPAAAQTTSHLNVPGRQIVSIRFSKATGDSYGQFSGINLYRGDGTNTWMATGQCLVVMELTAQTSYGPSTVSYPVSLYLSRTDSTGQFVSSVLSEDIMAPANTYSANLHMKSGVGIELYGNGRLRASAVPNNPNLQITAWDNVTLQGWGYITTF